VSLVRLLARGQDLREAAVTLSITYDTARTHQRNIRKKLGVHTSAELLALAKKNGLF